ncbi:hypothetical protein B0H13DRAFT_2361768 [Mycena leptocephala]|nr:hypothetical protein B0H13DRAFT_2361768 [Mycena leptocephala]
MTDFSTPAPAANSLAAGARATTLSSALQALESSVDGLTNATALLLTTPLSEIFTVLAGINHASEAVTAAAGDVQVAIAATASPSAAPVVTGPNPSLPASALGSNGPWIAGVLYSVTPLAPLAPVGDNGEKWFAITRGRYVGLTKNSAISLNAVTGISSGLSDKLASQAEALDHFNSALELGAVVVTQV